MKTTFISYANTKYKQRQQALILQSLMCGFDKALAYTDDWLKKEPIYTQYDRILTQERGAGYWLWKPYIILDTFKQIEYGDVVFYLDCGDWMKQGIVQYINNTMKQQDIILTYGAHRNKYWTKRDCFVLMFCDNEQYWEARQLEAGIIAIKKTTKNEEIVNEWFKYCTNEHILTDLVNSQGEPNFDGFNDHRHDQSILTNLCVKHNLYASTELRNFITCNCNEV